MAPSLLQLALGVAAGAALFAMRGSSAPLPQNVAQRRTRAATSRQEVERAITITRPVAEVYAFWRDFGNLARFMSHLESVRVQGQGRSHWVAKGPAGSRVEWDALLTEDEPERHLAWRSVEGSQIINEGRVDFIPAPADRGTEVRVRLTYHPPAGALGVAFARRFGEEPAQQVDEDLRRLKRLLETGAEPTNQGQPSGRKNPVTRGLAQMYDNRRTA
ncbi:SRPBCC family protein [Deinococcus aetherius]|uniref:SRPBCC family protein n=1 Tax=Deinococcus aetherius TaxID=200252 RepID=UPI0022321DE6|nr:SRPBCC family protein [Deinococcus aetherius]